MANTFKGLTVIIILTFLIIFTATPCLAFDVRNETNFTITNEEIINDDLYVLADTIVIDGDINGDIFALGRIIIINGQITGSIMAAGEIININGDIGHAIRITGKTINIIGDINGDTIVACNYLNINDTSKISGDLLFGAENINIDGLIEGYINGAGNEITINGKVKGNIDIKSDNLIISSTANIEGNLTYTSEEEANIQEGAKITGLTTYKAIDANKKQNKVIKNKIISFLMAFITGMIIILIAPKRLTSIAKSIRMNPAESIGWGILTLFIIPIISIIAFITIVGIPIGLIILALWLMAIYLAQIPVGLFIGSWIINHFRTIDKKIIMITAFALGLIILRLLKMIPHIGFSINIAIIVFGIGATIVSEKKLRSEMQKTISTKHK